MTNNPIQKAREALDASVRLISEHVGIDGFGIGGDGLTHWSVRDEYVSRAKQALSELDKINEWQDINTAPKDGTPVLLYGDWRKYYYKDGELVSVDTIEGATVNGCWNDETGSWRGIFGFIEPTHWMPLPQPPKESE